MHARMGVSMYITHKCVSVYMHVCVCLCIMHVSVCECIYVCLCVHACVSVGMHVFVCMHVCMHVYECVHVYMSMCACLCMSLCHLCVCMPLTTVCFVCRARDPGLCGRGWVRRHHSPPDSGRLSALGPGPQQPQGAALNDSTQDITLIGKQISCGLLCIF